MKILFVLDNYIPYIGGVETMFQQLAEGFYEKNWTLFWTLFSLNYVFRYVEEKNNQHWF